MIDKILEKIDIVVAFIRKAVIAIVDLIKKLKGTPTADDEEKKEDKE